MHHSLLRILQQLPKDASYVGKINTSPHYKPTISQVQQTINPLFSAVAQAVMTRRDMYHSHEKQSYKREQSIFLGHDLRSTNKIKLWAWWSTKIICIKPREHYQLQQGLERALCRLTILCSIKEKRAIGLRPWLITRKSSGSHFFRRPVNLQCKIPYTCDLGQNKFHMIYSGHKSNKYICLRSSVFCIAGVSLS